VYAWMRETPAQWNETEASREKTEP
jgi:hypothetical protein